MSITTVRSQPTPSWAQNINVQQNQSSTKKQNNTKQNKNSTQNSNSKGENTNNIQKTKPAKNKAPTTQQTNSSQSSNDDINWQEKQVIQKLRQRDSEVRQHELAHKTTGGQYAGSIDYVYQEGPNGRRYAVGGSVPMDLSFEPNNPKETIQKAERVRKAALAPAQPSAQDLKIASKAARIKMEAKAKLNNAKPQENSTLKNNSTDTENDNSADNNNSEQINNENKRKDLNQIYNNQPQEEKDKSITI